MKSKDGTQALYGAVALLAARLSDATALELGEAIQKILNTDPRKLTGWIQATVFVANAKEVPTAARARLQRLISQVLEHTPDRDMEQLAGILQSVLRGGPALASEFLDRLIVAFTAAASSSSSSSSATLQVAGEPVRALRVVRSDPWPEARRVLEMLSPQQARALKTWLAARAPDGALAHVLMFLGGLPLEGGRHVCQGCGTSNPDAYVMVTNTTCNGQVAMHETVCIACTQEAMRARGVPAELVAEYRVRLMAQLGGKVSSSKKPALVH